LLILFRFLSRWPLAWLHRLGTLLGWLTWLLSPTYRRHLQQNLSLALGAETAARIRKTVIAEAGKTVLELPKIWLRPLSETARQVVRISGWELFETARQRRQGILFMTPHLGCFEITAQYVSTHAPVTVLYRPPKQTWLQRLIEIGRVREQLHIAPADLSGVRILLKALKRGEAVGMLPDQAPKTGQGVWLDFFGKPAYTMTLAARLTQSGATPIMIWAERLPAGTGYHLHLRAPLRQITGTLEERTQQINHEIEDLIRLCPEQYLWGYNRYKGSRGSRKESSDRPSALDNKPAMPPPVESDSADERR